MMFSEILLSVGMLVSGLFPGSVEPLSDTLAAVSVTADKGVVVSRIDTLSVAGPLTVSDVLLQGTGFHVSDNGGAAGLKTVSMRGLGSAHTAIYIDGVRVGNVQSGQNDLSMTAMADVGSVIVDYAQNSVSFNTLRPKFAASPVAGDVRLSAGSFGTWLPSARLDFRLSEQVSLSANVSGVFSRGDFEYAGDLVRKNNDIRQIRSGLDLFGLMDRGDYHVKVCYNDADRGTPGPVDWPSEDRQKDKNAFIQGVLRRKFSHLYTLRLSGKVSYDDIFYSSSLGESRYGQTELQLNSSHDFQIRKWWKLSFASDFMWDALSSTNYDAERFTAFSALASSFCAGRFSADVAMEYIGTLDGGDFARNAFSPSVSLRLNVIDGFALVAFGRRAYRIPTFNELYYDGYGNPDLKPEDALLTGLGLDFRRSLTAGWNVKAKLDGFCNLLRDKITSAPVEAGSDIWRPYNIGRVCSSGFDLIAGFAHVAECTCALDIRYSLLSAVDMTPDSQTYGVQIPYIARHVLNLTGNVVWKGWKFVPAWNMRGGRSDGSGTLPDWNTLDFAVAKSFEVGKAAVLTLDFLARNILDHRYETVSGYPMPGRSFTGGLELKF